MRNYVFTEQEVEKILLPYVGNLRSFKENCGSSFDNLRKGFTSNLMKFQKKDGTDFTAKIKLTRESSNYIKINFFFKKKELVLADSIRFDKARDGKIELTNDDKSKLQKGEVILKNISYPDKTVSPILIQNDVDINQLYFMKQEWIKVPAHIYGYKLSEKEIESLKKGETIKIKINVSKTESKELNCYFSPVRSYFAFSEIQEDKAQILSEERDNKIENKEEQVEEMELTQEEIEEAKNVNAYISSLIENKPQTNEVKEQVNNIKIN